MVEYRFKELKEDNNNTKNVIIHKCSVFDCNEKGAVYTRKSPKEYDRRIWLCKLHAKIHNENWDYFKGLSDAEFEVEYKKSLYGDYKTIPFGVYTSIARLKFYKLMDDKIVYFTKTEHYTDEQRKAMKIIGIDTPILKKELIEKYRSLVKTYHPDKAGSSKNSHSTMAEINNSYKILKEIAK